MDVTLHKAVVAAKEAGATCLHRATYSPQDSEDIRQAAQALGLVATRISCEVFLITWPRKRLT